MICPICKKNTNKIITDTLRDGSKRKVFLCQHCELGILSGHQTADELKKFYAKNYRAIGKPKLESKSNPKELFEIYKQFQTDRLRLLKPYLKKNKKLLEVGCSAGMFLWPAKKLVGEAVGIDFDIDSAKFTAKKCVAKTYSTDISETPLKKNYFDIIVAFQTLEHVKDLTDFIGKYATYLKKGGTMAIEVPNLYDSLAHIYDLPNHYKFFYHSAHLWYFTEKSLLKLMEKCSFAGKVFHIQDYNILNHMNWILNDKPQPDCLPGLSAPVLPLRKTISPGTRTALNNFIAKTDKEYKKLLAQLKITSNIIFIGKKL